MRGWLSRLPWSSWWFVLTGVVFLLQVIPFTGIFLMLIAAPAWSILTVNAGFASLALEALFGSVGRVWLLAPLLWFGGYAAAAIVSDQRYHALDAAVRAQNAGQRVDFQPTTRSLVIKPNADEIGGLASAYVRDYRIPVTYEERQDHKTISHTGHRLAVEPTCSTIRSDHRHRAAGIFSHGVHARSERGTLLSKGICAITMPEDPVLPIVRVEASRRKAHGGVLVPHALTRITIEEPDGRRIQLTGGRASPLAWWPQPIMGCALNSGRPSWECVVRFNRRQLGVGGERAYGGANAEIIAGALGLERVTFSKRRDEISATPLPSLSAIIERRVTASLASLDAVIADPTRRITVHDVPGLREQPSQIESRVPAIIEAIGRALDGSERSRETARVLQRLVSALPASTFAAAGPPLLEVLSSRNAVDEARLTHELATRLGDLGADAVPILERALTSPRPAMRVAAIYGLCRAGAAAAEHAEGLLEMANGTRSNQDVATAVLVALRRMGRADLVERELAPEGRLSQVRSKVRSRPVSLESPPGVCTS